MANSLLTPTAVTREALRVLHQKLKFIPNTDLQYDDQYAKTGAKIGSDLKIRVPNQYTVRKGASLSAQDTAESSVTLSVASQYGVDLNFTSVDLTMSLDDFSRRIIDPSMAVLAATIEADILSSVYKDVYNTVTTPGISAAFRQVLNARKLLVDNLSPTSDWTINLQTQDNVDLVDALKGLFQDANVLAKQYREGYIGRTGGFDWYENTLLPTHTRGTALTSWGTDTRTSAMTVNTNALSTISSTLATGTLKAGDTIKIANVFRVHPESKVNTGVQQEFVVTADAASGATTVNISPPIILSGAYQNVTIPTVSATAATTATGTAGSSHPISLAFHKNAFAVATADLVMPQGVDWSARQVLDGISMRIVRQYDINNDKFPCRLDVLFGAKTLRAQHAVRMQFNGS